MSDEQPALGGALGYDHPSGFYLNIFGLGELGREAKFLGVVGNLGFAHRMSRNASVEIGALRSQIGSASPGAQDFRYGELYGGATWGPIAARVYYSPDYRSGHEQTLYAEIEAGLALAPKWRLAGHAGALNHLSHRPYEKSGADFDWRFSIAREFGILDLHAALSGGGYSGSNEYRSSQKARFTIGGSARF